jgi:hypothetical protein
LKLGYLKPLTICPRMFLQRTTFAYEETVSHLDQFGRNPLIESYLVQYLLVCFYAEVEERLKEIVSAQLGQIGDRKVASFIFKSSEGMIKRVKKAEINDLLSKFDCGDGDVISELLGDMNLQPYFDAITNRHRVSHDQGGSMTLNYFGQAIPCAEAILGKVEQVLANN